MQQLTLRLASPEDTTRFAKRLAPRVKPGDVILLNGGLGAGKTHFARALIQARLSVPQDVPSPTYTLIQTYDTDDTEIWHADLYRLSGPEEAVELGLIDAFDDAVCLIEWPERLKEDTPEGALRLTFEMTDTPGERLLLVQAPTDIWAEKLQDVVPI